MSLKLYDATLREGAQGVGASFSVEDKIRIVHLLDDLGLHYIEAGNPGSNPKDEAFYQKMKQEKLTTAKLAAFGPTCRVGNHPSKDEGIARLLSAQTPVVTIFGKAWDFHATNVLGISLAQNLALITDTIAYIVAKGAEVCFDAEHFFDGMRANPTYAIQVLTAAKQAGATYLALCDTNGGCMPNDCATYTRAATQLFGEMVGIHAHNDTGMAEANTIVAVQEGVGMVQVTANGMGERCGNADLFVTIPNLTFKLGYPCLPEDSMKKLRSTSLLISELLNLAPDTRKPYIGSSAFAHKAGMHIDGVSKHPSTFEHISPVLVGNERTFLLSEIAGRAAIFTKISQFFPNIEKNSPVVGQIMERIKQREFEGYQFEGADASFELEMRRIIAPFPPFFELKSFKVLITEPALDDAIATAMIEVSVGGQSEITADLGNGPVNALDKASRKALERFYPNLQDMVLSDYQVRVLDSKDGTASHVRVLIESRDKSDCWKTVGVSVDVIGASWIAMVDALEYKLLKDQNKTKVVSSWV